MAAPSPRLAPVTMTLSMSAQLSRFRHRQTRRRSACAPAPCGGQPCAHAAMMSRSTSRLDDVGSASTISAATSAPVIGLALPKTRAARTHVEAVQHRLDLLRMHLGAADVDDAAAPADEKTAIAAHLDHVAGVDEALRVGERRRVVAEQAQRAAGRAHAQGAVDEFHLDGAGAFQPAGGKAGAAVADGEHDARFGRGVGVFDSRARETRRRGRSARRRRRSRPRAAHIAARCARRRRSAAPCANASACRKYA